MTNKSCLAEEAYYGPQFRGYGPSGRKSRRLGQSSSVLCHLWHPSGKCETGCLDPVEPSRSASNGRHKLTYFLSPMASPNSGTSCEPSIQTHEPLGCTSHSTYKMKIVSEFVHFMLLLYYVSLRGFCWSELLAHRDGFWEVQVSHDRKAKGQCGTAGAFNTISKSKNIVL